MAPVNPDAILSLVGNLLSNAIRYTPGGGRVILRSSLRRDGIAIEVQDTGIGMDAETQAHIFDQFYRAPAARHLEAQGLGLGLSLVQRFVQAHEGQLEVESSPGKGTTVRVVLPLRASAL